MGKFKIGFLLLNPKFYEYEHEYRIDFSNSRPVINLYMKEKYKLRNYKLIESKLTNISSIKKDYVYEKEINFNYIIVKVLND
jgi:hypothetical protein